MGRAERSPKDDHFLSHFRLPQQADTCLTIDSATVARVGAVVAVVIPVIVVTEVVAGVNADVGVVSVRRRRGACRATCKSSVGLDNSAIEGPRPSITCNTDSTTLKSNQDYTL